MRRHPILSVVLLCAVVALSGCATRSLASSSVAKGAFSYACAAGGECAVYLTLTNPSREPDALVGASTAVAARTEMHRLKVDAQGGMGMQPVARVPLPAAQQVELQPGSLHLMLVDLTRELKMGETFELTLLYERRGAETVQVVVMPEN